MRIKGTYLKMNTKKHNPKKDKEISDFILIKKNKNNEQLTLISAPHLYLCENKIFGSNVAFFTHIPSNKEKKMEETLLIENQKSFSTEGSLFPEISTKKKKTQVKGLNIRTLRLRSVSLDSEQKNTTVEILRRISLALSVFTLTITGAAFGIEPTRSTSKKGLIAVSLFTFTILISYLGLKTAKIYPYTLLLVAFLPHAISLFASLIKLQWIRDGRG